ncbi:MAG: M28 family peptidase [Planctomycetota bacterium]|jgi:hypothetical protein
MTKKHVWKIVCGFIIVIVGVYCLVVLSFHFQQRKHRYTTELPSIGLLEYKEWGSKASVKVKKPDGSVIYIHYKNAKVIDKMVVHPKNHPLYGRVQPATNEKTLYLATELLPTLIEISKGEKVELDEDMLTLIEDYSPDLYRLNFKKEPNIYHLQLFDDLFLSGYDFRPNARMPYLAYWGPETGDAIGDDAIYCGTWALDKFCYNLPLEVNPENLYLVKVGDVIDFKGYRIIVEYIDHDNDQDPWNNSLILRVDGSEDVPKVKKTGTGRKPITPIDFINLICQKKQEDLKKISSFNVSTSEEDLKKQLMPFADAKTEEERFYATQKILFEYGYNENDIKVISNGYGNSKDFWIEKKGQSEDVAIITAHYDKAGQGSQGIHDNACGVVTIANLAGILRNVDTRLSYIFLFYGAHETDGHDWSLWLQKKSQLKSPIKYAIEVGGGGLIGAKQTFLLGQRRFRGWLNWRFPQLRINETGGPPDYQKHTAKDNINVCDFTFLLNSFKTASRVVFTIDQNL